MVGENTAANGPRLLTVRLCVSSCDEFVATYYPDVMDGGIFIRTNGVVTLETGEAILLRFQLQTGQEVFSGQAEVAWVQGDDEPGVGVRFTELDPSSERLHREMLAYKEVSAVRADHQSKVFARRVALKEFCDAPTMPRPIRGRGRAGRYAISRTAKRRRPPPLPLKCRKPDRSFSQVRTDKRVVSVDDLDTVRMKPPEELMEDSTTDKLIVDPAPSAA